jgi:protocatechuate 3,4-dioxygenase beta subunit
MRVRSLAFFVLASLAMAQQAPAPEKKLASVEGKIVDASTGEPVRKANLVLMQRPTAGGGAAMTGPPPSTAVSSDAEGKFSFTSVEPGRYGLSAEKAGYVRQQYGTRTGQFGPGTQLVLEPGQKIASIEFRLMPQAVITGKVLDDDGEPVPHTMVSVLRRMPLARQRMTMMAMSTNDVGEFRIANLAPGRYMIRAERRGNMFGTATPASADTPNAEGTLGYVPTYFPGVTEEASASEIAVAAGQQLSGMDIALRKGRVFQVSGKVQGAPAGNRVQVSLQPHRTGRGGMSFGFGGGVKPDGSFTVAAVTPGSWDAVVMNLESGRPQIVGRAPVTVTNTNVENVVIQAGSLLELTGRVIQEGDAKTSVTGQVMLQPVQPLPIFIQPARIQDDGTFKISGVSRDQFRVEVMGLSGDLYVRSVRAGNVDVTTSGLDLSAADSVPPVEIRVSAKGATVSGVVLDEGKPSPGAMVVALAQPFNPDQRTAMKSAGTDQNGRFTLQGITPGEYRIYAWDSFLPFNDLDPEQLKPFEKLAATVKLKEEAREQVELKLASVTRE